MRIAVHTLSVLIGVTMIWIFQGGDLQAPQRGLPPLGESYAPVFAASDDDAADEDGVDDEAGGEETAGEETDIAANDSTGRDNTVAPASFEAISPGPACIGVWSALPELSDVAPQGGRRLGGGLRSANEPAPDPHRFGCTGAHPDAGEYYVEARYLGGDERQAEAWHVVLACSGAGVLIDAGGGDMSRCEALAEEYDPASLGAFIEVINADTLRFEHSRVNVFGVDGPDEQDCRNQCPEECAAAGPAEEAVRALLAGREITVTRIVRRANDRAFAVVEADGEDLAELLLAEGHVVESPDNARNWCESQPAP